MRRFDHPFATQLAADFKRRRVLLGYSRERLAAAAGVSWESVMNIERGDRVPSLGLACRIGDVLGLKLMLIDRPSPLQPATSAMRAQLRTPLP